MSNSLVKISPVAGRIGALIEGVHISADLDAATVQTIREALLKYKVIFFRNQNHLDDASQEKLVGLFGEPLPHPTIPTKDGTNYIFELDSQQGHRADTWHTDVTYLEAYPAISILRGVVIPEYGGDTLWANTVAAYEDLPPALRELADKLWALHTNEHDYGERNSIVIPEDFVKYTNELATSTIYETEHPVVRVHPETGERSLLLGLFVKKILGVSFIDSARLFTLLQDHVTRPENTVRWRWAEGDVAIWDNRATQHYAINDYGKKQRVVRRVTVNGDVPVGVDGRTSKTHRKTLSKQLSV